MSCRAAILLLLIFCSGCVVRRQSYLLVSQGRERVLVPPGVKAQDLRARTVRADGGGRKACPPGGQAIDARGGKRVRISVRPRALAAQPRGWLRDWISEAEEQGCLARGAALTTAARIVEAGPLDSAAAFELLYGVDRRAGYVELGPGSRLQTVTPIMREGAAPDAPIVETVSVSGAGSTINLDLRATSNLLGYETAWYDMTPRPGGGHVLKPVSAERSIQDRVERADAPLLNPFRLPAEALYFRLFHKADVDGAAITEMLIGGSSLADLARRTRAIDAKPETCGAADPLCVVIPRRVAVNAYMAVTVNGKQFAVPGGSTVAGAIRAAGEIDPRKILVRLAVRRPWRDGLSVIEFDNSTPDILDVMLAGGEDISY